MNPQGDTPEQLNAETARYRLEKRSVRARFNRAAHNYDSAARVQRELGERLLEHLEPVCLSPARVLDVGAGTGDLARRLCKRFSGSRVLALDLAEGMMRVARSKTWRLFSRQDFICADAEQLPLADEGVDLVVSNATLQWCNNPDGVFSEMRRVLKPGGLLVFSTFGPDTLCELRQSFSQIDDLPHVHAFMDMHDLGDALVRSGFVDVVMDTARLTAEYGEVTDLMRELKAIGATNALSSRSRGLTGRDGMKRLAESYEKHRQDGVLPATFEAVFAHAWKPESRAGSGISVAPPRL